MTGRSKRASDEPSEVQAARRGPLLARLLILAVAVALLTTAILLTRTDDGVLVQPGGGLATSPTSSPTPSPSVEPSGSPTEEPSPEWRTVHFSGEWTLSYPADWRIDEAKATLWHLLNPQYPKDGGGYGGLPRGAVKIDLSINADTDYASTEDARRASCEEPAASEEIETIECGFKAINGRQWVLWYGRMEGSDPGEFLRLVTVSEGSSFLALANVAAGKEASANVALVRHIYDSFRLSG